MMNVTDKCESYKMYAFGGCINIYTAQQTIQWQSGRPLKEIRQFSFPTSSTPLPEIQKYFNQRQSGFHF